jgi:hypothetical protein
MSFIVASSIETPDELEPELDPLEEPLPAMEGGDVELLEQAAITPIELPPAARERAIIVRMDTCFIRRPFWNIPSRAAAYALLLDRSPSDEARHHKGWPGANHQQSVSPRLLHPPGRARHRCSPDLVPAKLPTS